MGRHLWVIWHHSFEVRILGIVCFAYLKMNRWKIANERIFNVRLILHEICLTIWKGFSGQCEWQGIIFSGFLELPVIQVLWQLLTVNPIKCLLKVNWPICKPIGASGGHTFSATRSTLTNTYKLGWRWRIPNLSSIGLAVPEKQFSELNWWPHPKTGTSSQKPQLQLLEWM